MNRKAFVKSGLLALPGLAAIPAFAKHSANRNVAEIDEAKIKEFVVAGHRDFDALKRMLEQEPNLIYARYDWGHGDYEEAIEGAGHLGNKEIATYLIEKGARVNLFVLTMLGKKNLVLPVLEEFPNLLNAKGPHGFTLLHHAKVGGSDAQELYDYFIEQGLTETKFDMN